jgi:hypothetical protein
MKIKPYVHRAPRHEVGLVLPSGRVLMEDGSRRRIGDLPSNKARASKPGLRLYADPEAVLGSFVMRGSGDVDVYNRSYTTWWPDDEHRVVLLRDSPGSSPDVLAGLVGVRDFLAERGASVGSMGGSTFSLLKASLPGPINFGLGPYGPAAIIPDNMGGRNESFAHVAYYPFAHVDLVAAYAAMLGQMFYDGRGSWTPLTLPELPDSPAPVIARATIRYPRGLEVAPLPRRLRGHELDDYDFREWPTSGRMTGTYEASELTCAIEAGCDVKVEQVWVRSWVEDDEQARPFAPWWGHIQAARALPGYAGRFGKLMGSALWGRFLAGSGWAWRYHFTESRPDAGHLLRRPLRNQRYVGYDLAELVTARVRARLYRELIVPMHAAGRLIGVHTDGGLVLDDGSPTDLGPDWRVKYRGRMQYVSPASYRYKVGDEHRWTYVMAGVPIEQQAQSFEEVWRAHRGKMARGFVGSLEVREAEGFRNIVRAFPEAFGKPNPAQRSEVAE